MLNWLGVFLYFFLYRFLDGDLIWFALGGASALLGWNIGQFFKNKWLKLIASFALAFLGIALAHYIYELFVIWENTPINEPMHIITNSIYLPLVMR